MSKLLTRVRNALLNDSTVAAAVGTKVYALRATQNVAQPYIVMSLVSHKQEGHLRGGSNLENARIRLDFFGEHYNGMLDLEEAARAALLTSVNFSAQHVYGTHMYEDDTRLYHLVSDFSVWHNF